MDRAGTGMGRGRLGTQDVAMVDGMGSRGHDTKVYLRR